MAKKSKSSNSTESYFGKLVSELVVGNRRMFADCFSVFLDLQLSFFCNNPDEHQKMLFDYMKRNESFRNTMTDAMTCYGDLAENYHDPLGDLFMTYVSHGQNGQFFTPESISTLMIRITGIADGATVNDPTCGSGRTLLKALELARGEDKEIELFGQDIDMTCCKMTLLNMLVNSAAGEVICGNTLLQDRENFHFFHIDKIRNLESGAIFSTYWQYTLETSQQVAKEREAWWWAIAEQGWIKYRHWTTPKEEKSEQKEPQIDPLPTEIKVDDKGQISLF